MFDSIYSRDVIKCARSNYSIDNFSYIHVHFPQKKFLFSVITREHLTSLAICLVASLLVKTPLVLSECDTK